MAHDMADVGSSSDYTPITVAIVDDHSMFADALGRIVEDEEDFKLVGIASTIEEALETIGRERPNVVLMDYQLPDGDGASATAETLRRWPDTKVVMLSGSGISDLLARAIESGCAGLLGKTRPAGDVVAAVRAAAKGDSVMRTDELAALLGQLRESPQQRDKLLTARELEVLKLLARARGTEEIAAELYISPHTVRNHVSNILVKLGAHSKLEAVANAVRERIIEPDEVGDDG
jgi:DNA-binding NarL/FixJ family response regulator